MHAERTDVDVAWAAGLFEGEGSLVLTGGKWVRMQLSMTDHDVVERFYAVMGIGSVSDVPPRQPGRKPVFAWYACRNDEVRVAMTALMPYLGIRRRTRAEELLAATSGIKGRSATHCPQGHEFTPENTYIEKTRTGVSRRCRVCRQAKERRAYVRRRATVLQRNDDVRD